MRPGRTTSGSGSRRPKDSFIRFELAIFLEELPPFFFAQVYLVGQNEVDNVVEITQGAVANVLPTPGFKRVGRTGKVPAHGFVSGALVEDSADAAGTVSQTRSVSGMTNSRKPPGTPLSCVEAVS